MQNLATPCWEDSRQGTSRDSTLGKSLSLTPIDNSPLTGEREVEVYSPEIGSGQDPELMG